jgi:hypothetical protein
VSDVPENVLDLPLKERTLLALRSGVEKAIAELTRQGLPVYMWSVGKVVDLTANQRVRPRRKPKRKSRSTTRR